MAYLTHLALSKTRRKTNMKTVVNNQ